MSKTFILNTAGVRELMQSEEMQKIINTKADEVRNRVGDGYEINKRVEGTRAVATVYADSFRARRDNMKNNTLLKGLGK